MSYFCLSHGISPARNKDPELVALARKGNLDQVKGVIKEHGASASIVNASRKWTEVEEKYGYDKTWDWHDDTPLIAAARGGHFEVVKYLLSVNADPTLESCHICDENMNAKQVAEKSLKIVRERYDRFLSGSARSYDINKNDGNSRQIAENLLTDIAKNESIIGILDTAAAFWPKASYAGSRFSQRRLKFLASEPNQPTNRNQLVASVENFKAVNPNMELLNGLISALERDFPSTRKVEICNDALNSNCPSGYSSTALATSAQQNQNLRKCVCGNAKARECSNDSCVRCCPGPCARHNLLTKRTCTVYNFSQTILTNAGNSWQIINDEIMIARNSLLLLRDNISMLNF